MAFSLGCHSNLKAILMKFGWGVLFGRTNTLLFSFTGSAVKNQCNSIRTAEKTLCKWSYFGSLGCPNGLGHKSGNSLKKYSIVSSIRKLYQT